jgi:hypothetical protein
VYWIGCRHGKRSYRMVEWRGGGSTPGGRVFGCPVEVFESGAEARVIR